MKSVLVCSFKNCVLCRLVAKGLKNTATVPSYEKQLGLISSSHTLAISGGTHFHVPT